MLAQPNGRASPSHGEGWWFESTREYAMGLEITEFPRLLHVFGARSSMGRMPTFHVGGPGSNPRRAVWITFVEGERTAPWTRAW